MTPPGQNGPLDGLDAPCATCDRPMGDHTLREWSECMGTMTTDLPFEQVPDDLAGNAAAAVREQFGLDPNVIVADHVVVKAATLDGHGGAVRVRLPALLHEFQVGIAGRPPVEVAKVAFIGGVDSMRAYGRLTRDSANGAANAAERGR
jgi:hypothetical protein